MELQKTKAKLLTKCINQQSEVIRQLQQEITDAQNQANDYGQPKDRYDAFRTKLMRQIELYAGQLDKAKIVIDTFQKIDIEKESTEVEFGSLVITNKQMLFVSAGLGKVELEGETYYAVSPHVPIFNALKGKKQGNEVVFNGTKLVILEIY
ncbi:MAG: hypothetical protein QM503_15230 [Bacteroidota bacterium]